jgi:hypothetical protein
VANRIEIKGIERFEATIARAAHDIGALHDGFDEAGRIVADAASSSAPVLTGALAASIESMFTGPMGTDISSGLEYAGPVHWGVPSRNIEARPFILEGARESEAQWTEALEHDAQKVCDSVKGA